MAVCGAYYWTQNLITSRNKKSAFFFLLPFIILFIVLNLILLQPWVWDNSKLLAWVSLAVSGLAGYAVYRFKYRKMAIFIFLVLTASGMIDAYRVLIPRLNSYQMYSAD